MCGVVAVIPVRKLLDGPGVAGRTGDVTNIPGEGSASSNVLRVAEEGSGVSSPGAGDSSMDRSTRAFRVGPCLQCLLLYL